MRLIVDIHPHLYATGLFLSLLSREKIRRGVEQSQEVRVSAAMANVGDAIASLTPACPPVSIAGQDKVEGVSCPVSPPRTMRHIAAEAKTQQEDPLSLTPLSSLHSLVSSEHHLLPSSGFASETGNQCSINVGREQHGLALCVAAALLRTLSTMAPSRSPSIAHSAPDLTLQAAATPRQDGQSMQRSTRQHFPQLYCTPYSAPPVTMSNITAYGTEDHKAHGACLRGHQFPPVWTLLTDDCNSQGDSTEDSNDSEMTLSDALRSAPLPQSYRRSSG